MQIFFAPIKFATNKPINALLNQSAQPNKALHISTLQKMTIFTYQKRLLCMAQ